MISAPTPDEQRALVQLCTPAGQPGSGRLRYAAAMYFNRAGQLSDDALEVYRICSPLDHEDPAGLLRMRGLAAEVPSMPDLPAELAINLLVDEAGQYLAGLTVPRQAAPGLAEVRAGLARWRNGPVSSRVSASENAVVSEWLAPALAALAPTHPALAFAIAQANPGLSWTTFDGYPVDQVGRDFADGHAYASIIGEDAVIPARDWELGLFLIPPHVLYRDHRHQAPELYAPLTGPHGWRFGPDLPLTILPAHRPVWNDPFVPHLTKVGPVPFLCLYVWTRDVNAGAEILPASDWADLECLRLEA